MDSRSARTRSSTVCPGVPATSSRRLARSASTGSITRVSSASSSASLLPKV
ncbi:Uncharacterised protein [Mycobacteroides abscessus subsp. abscessus]|nr:Uncharacterised protein [Mycobacteroides abscessus subsp. abscessus]